MQRNSSGAGGRKKQSSKASMGQTNDKIKIGGEVKSCEKGSIKFCVNQMRQECHYFKFKSSIRGKIKGFIFKIILSYKEKSELSSSEKTEPRVKI